MTNPSSQRLNSPALQKDFQLVTCKGLEEKGQSRNIYWLEAMIYFCLISNGKLFTCSAFQPHEIRSCVHRCVDTDTGLGASVAEVPCVETTPSFRPLIMTAGREEHSCSESSVQRETHKTKGCFPTLFCYCKLFSWKSTTRMGKGSPSWAGKQVCLSPQHLCRIVTSYPTQLHPLSPPFILLPRLILFFSLPCP